VYIPDEILDEIRSKADLVELVSQQTPVKKSGKDYWACCPFHKEKTPSFKIDPQKQLYYCFGCKKCGNVFHYVQELVNTDFPGAAQWLADRYGIYIPENSATSKQEQDRRKTWQENCLKLLNDAANWFQANLSKPEAAPAVNYLNSRGLDQESIRKFKLGYSLDSWDATITWAEKLGYTQDMLTATGLTTKKDEPNAKPYDRFRGRLIFPISDELGRVVGFSARLLDPEAKVAKYVNSPETEFFQKGKLLYGLHFARQAFKTAGKALICEGQLDVIACHRAGLTHAVAAQGTAFTDFHAKILKRSTEHVTLAFDADTAGQKATLRTTALLHEQGINVSIATLPEGDDPDGIFRKGGQQALTAILEQTYPAIPFIFESSKKIYQIDKPDELSKVVRQLLEVIQPFPDLIVRAGHCKWLAQQLNLPERLIMDELATMDASARKQAMPSAGPTPIQTAPQPSQRRPFLPPFAIPQVGESTLQALLELILQSKALAENLAQNEEVGPLIPDTPLGNAINLVLAHADQDEWDLAQQAILNSDLIADPTIAKIFSTPAFVNFSPESTDDDAQRNFKEAKQLVAFQDCVNKLILEEINRQLAELKTKLVASTSKEEVQVLQDETLQLITRKQSLQASAGR
jgi:DNA primase